MVCIKLFQRFTMFNPYAAETQFPAPNDEKLLHLCKNKPLQNVTIRLTKYLPQNILAIRVEFFSLEIHLKTHIYGLGIIRVNEGYCTYHSPGRRRREVFT